MLLKPGKADKTRLKTRCAAAWVLAAVAFMFAFASRPAQAQSAWPNEPPGSTLISDHPFDTIHGNGWTDGWDSGAIITSDPEDPDVMENSRTPTENNGADVGLPFSPQQELFVGFTIKFSNPHYGWYNGWYQKILLIEGTHTYMKCMDFSGGSCALQMEPDLQNDNTHITGRPGDNGIYSNCRVPLGSFHKIEIYMKRSTSSTSQDGIIRWWLDGALCGDYTTANLGSDFNEVFLGNIWDSVYGALGGPEYVRYGHAYVSIPNCPGGCPVTGSPPSGGGSTGGGTGNGIRVVTRQAVVPRNATIPLKVVPKIPLDNVTIQVIGVFQEEGFGLTGGTYIGGGVWNLTPADLPDLAVIPPPGYCGSINASLVITQNI